MSKPSNGAMKCAMDYNDGIEERTLVDDAYIIGRHVKPLVDAVERLLSETGKYDLNFITSDDGACDRAEQGLRQALREWKDGK